MKRKLYKEEQIAFALRHGCIIPRRESSRSDA